MGWEVDAFVGRLSVLCRWKQLLPSAVVFPLSETIGLVASTGALMQDIRARLPSVQPPSEDNLVSAWGVEASKDCTIAYFSLFEFGDEGDASGNAVASVWTNQQAVRPTGSLNSALRLLGVAVEKGSDEFETVGLGRYRKTDTWAAAAILNDLIEEAGDRVQGLLKGLAYPSHPTVRILAAGELGSLKQNAMAMLPQLMERAKTDPDYGVRLRAVSAMESMGAEAVPALRALLAPGQLQYQDKNRWSVILSLGRIGPAAVEATPELITILGTEPNYEQRYHAAQTLGQIGKGARAAIPALIEALRDPNERVRFHAIRALEIMEPDPGQAIPALLPLMRDSYNLVVEIAVDYLRKLGSGSAMVEDLTGVLQSSDNFKLRVAAAVSLGKLGGEVQAAVPALMEALRDQNIYVRNQAAVALGRMGPAARQAIPALQEFLKTCGVKEGNYARQALEMIRQENPSA